MANIPLKSIKFPGLDDTYTVPQVDDDLDTAGAAADAKATGDALTEINERLGDVEDSMGDLSDLDTQDKSSLVAAINEAAQSGGSLDPEVIAEAVDDWLDNHPEATTTVEDGSITYPKLASNVLNYVTPEMFGAKGDSTTDDTEAIQDALDYARTNHVSVRGYQQYATTLPLTISGSYMDIFLNVVRYSGSDCGIYVKGNYHTIRIMSLYCSNGKGIAYKADTANVANNKLYAMRIFANSHAVDFQISNGRWILYNAFDIRAIKSDTGNCFNGAWNANENIFMNSSCACEAGWAIYECPGRFYNFTLENNVLNGIYITGGSNYFAGFRIRELADRIVRRINGDTSVQGGTLIKFADASRATTKFVCDDFVPYEAIDVSDMFTPEDGIEEYNDASTETERTEARTKMTRLSSFQEIDAPIRYGDWDTNNGYVKVGKKMYVQGGRKICIPYTETEHTITNANYDMRDAQVALNNAKVYPTKMIIGVDSCVIHLPASYCPVGYSEFVVDQTHHTCTIYDYNDATTPIFDGSDLGRGVYRLSAKTDLDNNCLQKADSSSTLKFFDGSNYEWIIEKLDKSGVVSVSDYGAIGDGVTDDSQAIQDAVDSNYDIYFESNKTYYVASTITIDHDVHIHGGENTVIKTDIQDNALVNVFVVSGTLKKTTTLTTDYTSDGNTANSGNQFTLASMTDINIGDLMVITATDQYYSYAREYYYLGATLLIGDIYDGHLYTTNSMPFDVELTNNVSVKIYDAPTVIFENLNFIGDIAGGGHYKYMLQLNYCKNSIIKNCSMTDMDNGIIITMCENTLLEALSLSKSKESNDRLIDGYGIFINSSSDTVAQRIDSICGQSCITLSGTIPNINTYIRYCNLGSECRTHGIGMHENSYNIVVEDCVLAGLDILGTGYVNRCRFIRNNRIVSDVGISFYGSHNPKFAVLKVSNCTFEASSRIYVSASGVQDPIQSYDNIVGLIEIKDCEGGYIEWEGKSTSILSNVIQNMRLERWINVDHIFRPSSDDIIENLYVSDCKFLKGLWISDHVDAHGLILENIYNLDYKTTIPMEHKISVDKDTMAERYTLPGKNLITLESENASAKFIVCGRNLAPNIAEDYYVGSISASAGNDLTRTVSTGSGTPTVTNDTNGNIVYTQKNNTSNYSMFPVGLFRVTDTSLIKMSSTIKNTGGTTGASFRPYIIKLDPVTGKVISSHTATPVEATAAGASVELNVEARDCVAMFYYYCRTPVALSETTFEDLKVSVENYFAPVPLTDDDVYEANRRTGDGNLLSLPGVNNIMCSEMIFNVKFQADLIG